MKWPWRTREDRLLEMLEAQLTRNHELQLRMIDALRARTSEEPMLPVIPGDQDEDGLPPEVMRAINHVVDAVLNAEEHRDLKVQARAWLNAKVDVAEVCKRIISGGEFPGW